MARFQANSPGNKSENIHFDVIQYSCPQLLEIPFLNQRWGGETRVKAESLGVDINPVEIETSKSFPWQFDAYPQIRNACLNELLEHFDGFSPWLDREKIISFMESSPDETKFNSADIKIVFGLGMAAKAFSDRCHFRPDHMNGQGKKNGVKMNQGAQKVFDGDWQYEKSTFEGDSVSEFENIFRANMNIRVSR